MRKSSWHDLPITILISTYDMRMVQELFPRTIVMDDGRIVADGMIQAILEDETFLREHGLEKPWQEFCFGRGGLQIFV